MTENAPGFSFPKYAFAGQTSPPAPCCRGGFPAGSAFSLASRSPSVAPSPLALGCLPPQLPLHGPSSTVLACHRFLCPASVSRQAAGAAAALGAGKKSRGAEVFQHAEIVQSLSEGDRLEMTQPGVLSLPGCPCFPALGQSIACLFRQPCTNHTSLPAPAPHQGKSCGAETGSRCHHEATQLLASIETEPALKSQALLKSGASNCPWLFLWQGSKGGQAQILLSFSSHKGPSPGSFCHVPWPRHLEYP